MHRPRSHVFAAAVEMEYRRDALRNTLRRLRLGGLFALLLAFIQTGATAYAVFLARPETIWVSGLELAGIAAAGVGVWRLHAEKTRMPAQLLVMLVAACWLATLVQAILVDAGTQWSRGARFEAFWPGFLLVEFYLFSLVAQQLRYAAVTGAAVIVAALCCGAEAGAAPARLLMVSGYLLAMYIAGLILVRRIENASRYNHLARRRAANHVGIARSQRLAARAAQERADAEHQLQRRALALVESERGKVLDAAAMKERFFTAAYHDMQQPLSTINLFVHALARRLNGAGMDAARRDLDVIARSTTEIAAMFQGVREIWELGHYAPRLEAVELTAVIDELSGQLASAARDKGLELRVFRRMRPPCWVTSDRMLLKRALTNLLSNAIKYTPAGGIVVGFVARREAVRVDVVDTGVGIDPSHHDQIFEEYFQVGTRSKHHPGGLGLGLSIVRRIEQALPGHEVTLASRPGRGTRFSLSLPAAHDLAVARAPAASADREHAALRDRLVAVVENDPAQLSGLLATLRAAGCLALGASGWEAAQREFAALGRAPDALITDYVLDDGKTGLDVIALAGSVFDWSARIPVVLVTGEILSREMLDHLPTGSLLHRKPVDLQLLLGQLDHLLHGADAEPTARAPSEAPAPVAPV